MLTWQHEHLPILCVSMMTLTAADDDFVICRNAPYGQVLVLPSRRLVRPAADDVFVRVLEANKKQVPLVKSYSLEIRIDSVNQILKK